jgi:molybdopterin-containing oxidoreductase family iron-sulfur binding subunit
MRRVKASAPAEEEAPTGKKVRSWCMVIDLKKCEGCVTIDAPPQCTQACIAFHYVPNGQEWIQVFEVDLPGGGTYYLPVPCMHCENAPCVNVCPVAATYHTREGIVLVDHNRCIGCRMCMAACPYQRRFFNWRKPELPAEAALAEYSPEYPVPAVVGTVMKCVWCANLVRDGRLTACVTGCPMKALYFGDLEEDVATNGVEIVKLSRFLDDNSAYRYKEELGTQPRVWYLPGHGEAFGHRPDDPRPFKPPQWSWGNEQKDLRSKLWPW